MSKGLANPVTADDHAQGPADAPVTLVEYGDYQCPACGMAYPLVKQIQQRHAGRLRFVFRNFPLSEAHPLATLAAEIAEGAATVGKFWEMHDWLYDHQQRWSQGGPEGVLEGLRALDIDPLAIEDALRGDAITARVRHDFMGGVRSGVNGTPGFFVNGRLHEGDFEELDRAIGAAIEGRG